MKDSTESKRVNHLIFPGAFDPPNGEQLKNRTLHSATTGGPWSGQTGFGSPSLFGTRVLAR